MSETTALLLVAGFIVGMSVLASVIRDIANVMGKWKQNTWDVRCVNEKEK